MLSFLLGKYLGIKLLSCLPGIYSWEVKTCTHTHTHTHTNSVPMFMAAILFMF